ncbi:MAG: hypothetical protein M3Y81_24340 [Chloroflexota bacterium]|nr:hypothetical protein [Chloroflexota bacterium]
MVADMQGLDGYSPDETVVTDNGTGVEAEDTSSDEKITEPFDPALIRVDTGP